MNSPQMPTSMQLNTGKWISPSGAEGCGVCGGRGWRWECEDWDGCSNTFCPQVVCEACQRKPYCMCSKYRPHRHDCPLVKAELRAVYGPPNYPPDLPLRIAVPIKYNPFVASEEPQPAMKIVDV